MFQMGKMYLWQSSQSQEGYPASGTATFLGASSSLPTSRGRASDLADQGFRVFWGLKETNFFFDTTVQTRGNHLVVGFPLG